MDGQLPVINKTEPKLFGRYHDLVLLLIGFGLTTLVGGSLGYYFQRMSWRNENNVRRYEAEIAKASEIFDDISGLLDRRLYATRRLIWAYQENDTEAIKKQREIYGQVVYDWNGTLNRNLSRAQRYFGNDMRDEFDSIREGFRGIDAALVSYRRNPNPDELQRIENMVDEFNPRIYGFNIRVLTRIQEGKVGIFLYEKIPSR